MEEEWKEEEVEITDTWCNFVFQELLGSWDK